MKITRYQSSTTKRYFELLYAFEISICTLNETFILVFCKLIFCDQYKFEITVSISFDSNASTKKEYAT